MKITLLSLVCFGLGYLTKFIVNKMLNKTVDPDNPDTPDDPEK